MTLKEKEPVKRVESVLKNFNSNLDIIVLKNSSKEIKF